MRTKLITPLVIAVLVTLSYFAVQPLFIEGFFPMHDDTQPSRVYEMTKSILDGLFPVRWVADLGYGYGYPIFNFYGPLAYYIGAFFVFFGFDALNATKIMIAIGTVLAGITMYFLGREFWGRGGGLVSAIFYVFAPYHAVNIYVRGAIAELWAYALVPLVFLGLYKVMRSSKLQAGRLLLPWSWISVGALGYSGVIVAHNLSALMTTILVIPLILLFIIISFKQKIFVGLLSISLTILLGALISAFYWLPIPFEMQYTNVASQIGAKADYNLHFVCPTQVWESMWGFGGSAPGCLDGMSFKVGKLHLIFTLLAVVSLPFLWIRKKLYFYVVSFALVSLSMSLLLMTELSKPFWDTFSFMAYLQYPWRFLLFVALFSSFLAGLPIWLVQDYLLVNKLAKYKLVPIALGTSLSLVAVLIYSSYFKPQTIRDVDAETYTSESALKWDISKISDEYMPREFNKPTSEMDIVRNKISIISGVGIIHPVETSTGYLKAGIVVEEEASFLVKTAPFPAWEVFLNGERSEPEPTSDGYIIDLPPGEYVLELIFRQTLVEKVANTVSLAGIVILIIGIMKKRTSP